MSAIELQADVERVLALSKLVDDTPWSRGNYEAAAVALIGDHGATISAMAELLEMAQSRVRELETRQSSAAAVNAWRAVDTANTALAERLAAAQMKAETDGEIIESQASSIFNLTSRLAVAEERVRVLENNVIERQAWSDIQDRQL